MIEINGKWLKGLGVKAPNEKVLESLVEKASSELELRVGNFLVSNLSDAQIDEFGATEEDKRLKWLERAYPDYKKVVKAEYDNMSKQIETSKNKIKLIESWSQ